MTPILACLGSLTSRVRVGELANSLCLGFFICKAGSAAAATAEGRWVDELMHVVPLPQRLRTY